MNRKMRARVSVLAAALMLGAAAPQTAHAAAAACGQIILNTATVTLWSGPIDQIGYALTYNASAQVRVICPVVLIDKRADRAVASAGSTVTFSIWIDNQYVTTDGSVWNVTITDRLPYGMALDNPGMNIGNWNVGALANTDVAWATSPAGPWTLWSTPPALWTVSPLWLRWRVPRLGPSTSGCVTYRATIQ
jgi:uncharacterized repeat protein (TIGR01451 family)